MTIDNVEQTPKHISVLLDECIENLNIKPDGTYLDGTLGMGGHSFEIASRLSTGRLICIDRDETAIERAGRRLAPFGDKVTLVHGNFSDAASILDSLGIEGVDGMLFDLGVSSPQLDEAERGFSYMVQAPLDMRMDQSGGLSAYEVVNTWDENRLNRILWDYGEERYARRITAAILKHREEKPIETTQELVDIIRSAMPAAALREKQHPAKRSFQAIRIAVNDELGAIASMMETAPDKLNHGGRLCVISFHSLEDRIVKSGIQAREHGCTCPREAPVCTCGFVQTLKVRKPQADPPDGGGDRPQPPRQKRQAPGGRARMKRASALAFRVICLGFSALLLVMTLFTHIRLVRTQSRIAELEAAITRAENEQIQLQIKTASALDLSELERRAVQELGMRRPEPGQIVEIEYLG